MQLFRFIIQPFREIMQPVQGITHPFRGSTHAFRRVVDTQRNFPVITPLRRIDSLSRVEGKKQIDKIIIMESISTEAMPGHYVTGSFSKSISE